MINEDNEPKKTYSSIEDIPGVGTFTSKVLRESGFHTVESLGMATVRELVQIGINEKKAVEIINISRIPASMSTESG